MTPLVAVIVTLGMLVIVPLGLRLIDGAPGSGVFAAGAVPGAISLWLDQGPLATTLATGYLLVTLYLALHALPRLRRPSPLGLAVATALVSPSIAAVSLVAERADHPLFGYTSQMLSLTVAHFHFAGFAAALIAGLVSQESGSRAAALTVPAGTLLVLGGYFVGDWAELAGSAVLTAGMWWVGWLAWRRTGAERVLITISSVVLVPTMLLAMAWALGEATGLPHPTIGTMIALHGVGNAFGFALCSVAAWRRLRPRPL